MKRILVISMLLFGLTSLGFSSDQDRDRDRDDRSAPEIDPGQAASALALLSGATLIVRGRRKK